MERAMTILYLLMYHRRPEEEGDRLKGELEQQLSHKKEMSGIMRTMADALMEKGKKIGIEEGERIGVEKGERIGVEKGERIGVEKGERIGVEKGERIGVEKGVRQVAGDLLRQKVRQSPREG